VGTRLDQVTLLGDEEKAADLDRKVMDHLGATANWENVGQVYPRSLDFEVVSLLVRLAAAPANFATTLRIMAGMNCWAKALPRGRLVPLPCLIK
jgi:adenylosuccinate lyase